MSIESQIKAAWKEESPKVRESLQCSRASQVLGAAEIGFTAGYLAALRGLYREFKPEDVSPDGWYYFLTRPENDTPRWLYSRVHTKDGVNVYWGMEMKYTPVCDALRIVRERRFPSHSDIFGNN